MGNATKKACSEEQYLLDFDAEKHGDIHKQDWAKQNITKFHNSNNYEINQCKVCFEAWPLREAPKCRQNYTCSRCLREKESPIKFSKENFMIPSVVPSELSGLTQVEEMLVARALPIIHIYIKPGGQRGYSGHTINLPQNVSELANSLPRYPKDLSIIVVKAKGKGNFVKSLSVRKQLVSDAIHWLIENNRHYSDIELNYHALNSLPVNSVPNEILSIETNDTTIDDNASFSPDFGPVANEEDIVHDSNTDSSSFVPVNDTGNKKLISFIRIFPRHK